MVLVVVVVLHSLSRASSQSVLRCACDATVTPWNASISSPVSKLLHILHTDYVEQTGNQSRRSCVVLLPLPLKNLWWRVSNWTELNWCLYKQTDITRHHMLSYTSWYAGLKLPTCTARNKTFLNQWSNTRQMPFLLSSVTSDTVWRGNWT